MDHKRNREDDESSPDSKRIHSDLLVSILSDDDSDCDPADLDVDLVVKSLEEEIGLLPASEKAKVGIEYLQEASDDELGIPPPETALLGGGGEEEVEGFGRIWVFEDDGNPVWYEGLVEFGGVDGMGCC